VTTPDPPHPLHARYDALWNDAAPLVRAGGATLDPWALHKAGDGRRGLTLLARPAPAVADRLVAFLERLRALEPGQYYQPRADLHHTVLSLFTATVDHAAHLAHEAEYEAAVAEAAAETPAFEIAVQGVTLAPGAVLAQGFPRGDALERLRERLRAGLVARGLGGGLDQRYRLVTAHMTIARFAAPLRDPGRFVDALAEARATPFGVTLVDRLELVLGDWYQSAERERPVAAYALAPRGVRRAPAAPVTDTSPAR
jgi:2'-5' RNA ligase